MKKFWWTLIVIWSIPALVYMIITKEPSKVAKFLLNKVGL
jgi:hypothetical protein